MAVGEFSLQGIIDVAGTTLCIVPAKFIIKVTAIRVNNSNPHTFQISKYDAATASLITIYRVDMAAGDTLTDNFTYFIEEGENIVLESTIPNTSYVLYGTKLQLTF
jgi:hypothetical protein